MTSSRKRSSSVFVGLTERALCDVQMIEIHSVEQWGRKVADRYLDDISAALDRLSEKPEILRLEPDFSSNLFFYRVNKHYLVCDYDGKMVIVLAVIHTSMSLPARLQELEPRLIAESQLLKERLSRKRGTN